MVSSAWRSGSPPPLPVPMISFTAACRCRGSWWRRMRPVSSAPFRHRSFWRRSRWRFTPWTAAALLERPDPSSSSCSPSSWAGGSMRSGLLRCDASPLRSSSSRNSGLAPVRRSERGSPTGCTTRFCRAFSWCAAMPTIPPASAIWPEGRSGVCDGQSPISARNTRTASVPRSSRSATTSRTPTGSRSTRSSRTMFS